jgi:hypothetical protein
VCYNVEKPLSCLETKEEQNCVLLLTSKRTPLFTITKINWLILFKEIIVVKPFEAEARLNGI